MRIKFGPKRWVLPFYQVMVARSLNEWRVRLWHRNFYFGFYKD